MRFREQPSLTPSYFPRIMGFPDPQSRRQEGPRTAGALRLGDGEAPRHPAAAEPGDLGSQQVMGTIPTASRNFPGASYYSALRRPVAFVVREPGATGRSFAWTERHLQCAWSDRIAPPGGLMTDAGEPLVVEDPGRWNLGSGPDFLDAALVIGPDRRRISGDIEIHVSPRDWIDHGHGNDPAYAGVIAHVTYFGGGLPPARLPSGAVQLTLADALMHDPSFSFESIDVTAYPYAAVTRDPPPCAVALRDWSSDDRALLLEVAGEERLRVKSSRMARAIEDSGAEQALYEEIMCALGYKNNRVPFRRLARLLPLDALREESGNDVHRAYALLLGVADLMPRKTSARWNTETRRFVRTLWDHWWKEQAQWQGRSLARSDWRLSGLRPQNHPARRLAAAACLFGSGIDLHGRLQALDTADPSRWFSEAGRLLSDGARMPYWRQRLSLSGKGQKRDIALLGKARIAAILSNAAIPLLAATGSSTTPLHRMLPGEDRNSIVRQAAHSLFGRDHNPSGYRSGLRQQGLIQIFHDFCLNTGAGCAGCALPTALRSSPPPRGKSVTCPL